MKPGSPAPFDYVMGKIAVLLVGLPPQISFSQTGSEFIYIEVAVPSDLYRFRSGLEWWRILNLDLVSGTLGVIATHLITVCQCGNGGSQNDQGDDEGY